MFFDTSGLAVIFRGYVFIIFFFSQFSSVRHPCRRLPNCKSTKSKHQKKWKWLRCRSIYWKRRRRSMKSPTKKYLHCPPIQSECCLPYLCSSVVHWWINANQNVLIESRLRQGLLIRWPNVCFVIVAQHPRRTGAEAVKVRWNGHTAGREKRVPDQMLERTRR